MSQGKWKYRSVLDTKRQVVVEYFLNGASNTVHVDTDHLCATEEQRRSLVRQKKAERCLLPKTMNETATCLTDTFLRPT